MASPSGPKWLDVYDTPYSNGANTTANAFLLALICASLVACVAAAWRTRRFVPFSFVMCVAYVFEIAAYALRFQPWDYTRFSTEVGLFTIAPVFITIGIHLCTAEVLTTLGAEHSPLSPGAHLRLFVAADLAALLLQGVGLGLTFSGARGAGPWGLLLAAAAHPGQALVFAGLLLQALALACALGLLAAAYAAAGRAARRRYGSYAAAAGGPAPAHPHPLPARLKTFLAALPLAGACVLARCAYRAAAAWGGLGSPVARDGVAWLVAEGVLLTEAMATLAALHPGVWLLGGGGGRRGHDVEGGPSSGHGAAAAARRRRMSPAAAKRLSSGTTLSSWSADDDLEQEKHARGRRPRDAEARQGLMAAAPDPLAPSEAGSFSEAGSPPPPPGGPWRGSVGGVLDVDPYYRFEDDSPYDPHRPAASPSPPPMPPPLAVGRRYYPAGDEDEDGDDVEYVTAETRGLSPMEAGAEQARLEAASLTTAPEPPRKSSKRTSRVLEHHDGAHPYGRGEEDEERHERHERHDGFDAESFVEPPRKSSKRASRVLVDDGGGGLAARATGIPYAPSPPPLRKPSRKGTLRVPGGADEDDEDEDRMEVESIVLPPRKPSKRETLHGGDEEDLDAVSLYSQ